MFVAFYHQARHYRRQLLILLLACSCAGCGFHLRGHTQLAKPLQTLSLISNDPYGPFVRDVREQLRLNNVTLVKDSNNTKVTSLRIVSTSSSQDTVSVFQDGTTAEYQLALKVDAQVLVPGQDLYPIHVTVFRSFFDNPLTALAKDAEQSMILQEMQKNAAEQLVRKLITVPTEQVPASSASATPHGKTNT